jgi:hypothetical protein
MNLEEESIEVQIVPCKSLIYSHIYSLPPLATWVSYHPGLGRGICDKARRAVKLQLISISSAR